MPVANNSSTSGSQTSGSGSKPKGATNEEKWVTDPETGRRVRKGKLLAHELKLRELLMTASGIAALSGDEFVANAIELHAEQIAYGWANLAREDKRIKLVLDKLTAGGAWGEALAPTLALTVAIAWHRGIVPDRLGVPVVMMSGLTPVSREAEVEAQTRMREQAKREGTESADAE